MTATRKHFTSQSAKGNQAVLQRNAPKSNLALELSWNVWKLAFAVGPGDHPRLRSVWGRHMHGLLQEVARAKKRFGLGDNAAVHRC